MTKTPEQSFMTLLDHGSTVVNDWGVLRVKLDTSVDRLQFITRATASDGSEAVEEIHGQIHHGYSWLLQQAYPGQGLYVTPTLLTNCVHDVNLATGHGTGAHSADETAECPLCEATNRLTDNYWTCEHFIEHHPMKGYVLWKGDE